MTTSNRCPVKKKYGRHVCRHACTRVCSGVHGHMCRHGHRACRLRRSIDVCAAAYNDGLAIYAGRIPVANGGNVGGFVQECLRACRAWLPYWACVQTCTDTCIDSCIAVYTGMCIDICHGSLVHVRVASTAVIHSSVQVRARAWTHVQTCVQTCV